MACVYALNFSKIYSKIEKLYAKHKIWWTGKPNSNIILSLWMQSKLDSFQVVLVVHVNTRFVVFDRSEHLRSNLALMIFSSYPMFPLLRQMYKSTTLLLYPSLPTIFRGRHWVHTCSYRPQPLSVWPLKNKKKKQMHFISKTILYTR